MTYRTLEAVLHPDSHLALPATELPERPVRVMVTILNDDKAPSADKVVHIRSPRLVHPEQAADFAVKIVEVMPDASV